NEKLKDDNKALDHLTKSKEFALLEVERKVQSALAKASMVDDLQNKNQELMKQIEICQNEKLKDDNKALDHLTKSKEFALLEVERKVQSALAKASMVDDLQNKNQELMKQIEICQEENKILDKMHRQKVSEVEKLTQTKRELEEDVLAGGAAANAVRDYQRKRQE
ncbi:hypothetical protein SOVF_114740, partial [Spinacia oleracea]